MSVHRGSASSVDSSAAAAGSDGRKSPNDPKSFGKLQESAPKQMQGALQQRPFEAAPQSNMEDFSRPAQTINPRVDKRTTLPRPISATGADNRESFTIYRDSLGGVNVSESAMLGETVPRSHNKFVAKQAPPLLETLMESHMKSAANQPPPLLEGGAGAPSTTAPRPSGQEALAALRAAIASQKQKQDVHQIRERALVPGKIPALAGPSVLSSQLAVGRAPGRLLPTEKEVLVQNVSSKELFEKTSAFLESGVAAEVRSVSSEELTMEATVFLEYEAVDVAIRVVSVEDIGARAVFANKSRREVVRFNQLIQRAKQAMLPQSGAWTQSSTCSANASMSPLGPMGCDDFSLDDLEFDEDDWILTVLDPLLQQACSEKASEREGAAVGLASHAKSCSACRGSLAKALSQRSDVMENLLGEKAPLNVQYPAAAALALSCGSVGAAGAQGALAAMVSQLLGTGVPGLVHKELTTALQNLQQMA